ncbi:hypothetical protein Ancab_024147 [Ancistrocladus abbreviatus]
MKQIYGIRGYENAVMGRRIFDKRTSNRWTVVSERHNRCVVIPVKANIVAECMERKDDSWFVQTKVPSDLVIQIGNRSSFHLHMVIYENIGKYVEFHEKLAIITYSSLQSPWIMQNSNDDSVVAGAI